MALDRGEQKLVDDVAEHGWHVVMVSSAVGEPDELPFAYTVGLQASFGWPELLCYGLATDTLAALLNNAVNELREDQRPPAEGLVLHRVANGFQCRLSPIARHQHREHLGFAIWFARYRGVDPSEIQCLQMLWPDREGRFPDEPGCAEGVKEVQPPLAV